MEFIIVLAVAVGLLALEYFLYKVFCQAVMWGFIALFVIFSIIGLVCGL